MYTPRLHVEGGLVVVHADFGAESQVGTPNPNAHEASWHGCACYVEGSGGKLRRQIGAPVLASMTQSPLPPVLRT